MKVKHLFLVIFLMGVSAHSIAQKKRATPDTLKITHENLDKIHSPKKATILSAVIPGAGQIYNKKYYKAPIIWAAFGVSLYLAFDYRSEYQFWKNEYLLELGYPNTESQYHGQITTAGLLDFKDTYKRWMELSFISMGAIYVLQILDANVDAQLLTFDVSDDLSLNLRPDSFKIPQKPVQAFGLALTLQFK